MKKIFAVVLLLILFGATTLGSFSWWDNVVETENDETFLIGSGNRLVLYNQTTPDQGILVPANSYYSTKEGYVSEYILDYTLVLEQSDSYYDLQIDINDLFVGDLPYTPTNEHLPLHVEMIVENESLGMELVNNIGSSYNSYRIDQIIDSMGDVSVKLIFSLVDNNTISYDVESLKNSYDYVADKEISFNLQFKVLSD